MPLQGKMQINKERYEFKIEKLSAIIFPKNNPVKSMQSGVGRKKISGYRYDLESAQFVSVSVRMLLTLDPNNVTKSCKVRVHKNPPFAAFPCF